MSDSQLISVEQLEDHVADLSEEDLKLIKTDTHNFLEYWSYGRKQHSADEISRIFGIVRMNVPQSYVMHQCFMSYRCSVSPIRTLSMSSPLCLLL